jgi:hypothetical protein
MLAREDNILMIPVIGTGFRVVKEGIVLSMMVQDDALSWFESIATLVRESAILAFVSVQETCHPTPITGDPFLSFCCRWVVIGLGNTGE